MALTVDPNDFEHLTLQPKLFAFDLTHGKTKSIVENIQAVYGEGSVDDKFILPLVDEIAKGFAGVAFATYDDSSKANIITKIKAKIQDLSSEKFGDCLDNAEKFMQIIVYSYDIVMIYRYAHDKTQEKRAEKPDIDEIDVTPFRRGLHNYLCSSNYFEEFIAKQSEHYGLTYLRRQTLPQPTKKLAEFQSLDAVKSEDDLVVAYTSVFKQKHYPNKEIPKDKIPNKGTVLRMFAGDYRRMPLYESSVNRSIFKNKMNKIKRIGKELNELSELITNLGKRNNCNISGDRRYWQLVLLADNLHDMAKEVRNIKENFLRKSFGDYRECHGPHHNPWAGPVANACTYDIPYVPNSLGGVIEFPKIPNNGGTPISTGTFQLTGCTMIVYEKVSDPTQWTAYHCAPGLNDSVFTRYVEHDGAGTYYRIWQGLDFKVTMNRALSMIPYNVDYFTDEVDAFGKNGNIPCWLKVTTWRLVNAGGAADTWAKETRTEWHYMYAPGTYQANESIPRDRKSVV